MCSDSDSESDDENQHASRENGDIIEEQHLTGGRHLINMLVRRGQRKLLIVAQEGLQAAAKAARLYWDVYHFRKPKL